MEKKNSKVLPQALLVTFDSEVSEEHMGEERGMTSIPHSHRSEAIPWLFQMS